MSGRSPTACRSSSSAAIYWKRSPAGGRSAARFARSPGRYYTATGSSSIGNRRANYTGAEIRIDDGNELRWFNTDAFTVPAEDAKGTATVGQILGPSFYQWDLSMRKNFRFGGHYVVSPIFDVFNLFNRLNLGAPNTDVSNLAYGTINSAQPSRQFQLGIKFDF